MRRIIERVLIHGKGAKILEAKLPAVSQQIKMKYAQWGLDDRKYAEERWQNTFGYLLNLNSPNTFNEKIQWIKLFYRDKRMNQLADKYGVRQYVADKVGEKYLNSLYGVYQDIAEIKRGLNDLPDSFVLKATHGSGWNIIVSKKSQLSAQSFGKLRRWLQQNYYLEGREWCYKDIPPRVISEEYIETSDPTIGLLDYKFFCFQGKPTLVQVDVDRFTAHKRNLYDLQWNQLPIEFHYPHSAAAIPKPKHLAEMIEVARSLSEGFPFARVDLYCEPTVIFGEITFYPECGFGRFMPASYDRELGELLHLPINSG